MIECLYERIVELAIYNKGQSPSVTRWYRIAACGRSAKFTAGAAVVLWDHTICRRPTSYPSAEIGRYRECRLSPRRLQVRAVELQGTRCNPNRRRKSTEVAQAWTPRRTIAFRALNQDRPRTIAEPHLILMLDVDTLWM